MPYLSSPFNSATSSVRARYAKFVERMTPYISSGNIRPTFAETRAVEQSNVHNRRPPFVDHISKKRSQSAPAVTQDAISAHDDTFQVESGAAIKSLKEATNPKAKAVVRKVPTPMPPPTLREFGWELTQRAGGVIKSKAFRKIAQTAFDPGYVFRKKIDVRPLLQNKAAIQQGANTGDCYVVASIESARQSKTASEQLATSKLYTEKNGSQISFDYTFPAGLHAKVTAEELGKQASSGNKPLTGASLYQLFESVYAKAVRGLRNDRRANPFPEDGKGKSLFLAQGGQPEVALQRMFGGEDIVIESKTVLNAIKRMRRDQNRSYILTATTPQEYNGSKKPISEKLSSGETVVFHPAHAFSFFPVPGREDVVRVVNPHNTEKSIELTLDEFKNFFSKIRGIRIPRNSQNTVVP